MQYDRLIEQTRAYVEQHHERDRVTSVAVLVFFRRQAAPVRSWKRSRRTGARTARAAGNPGLILQNLPTLVGNSVPLAIAVVVLILACFGAGAVVGSKRPQARAGAAPTSSFDPE